MYTTEEYNEMLYHAMNLDSVRTSDICKHFGMVRSDLITLTHSVIFDTADALLTDYFEILDANFTKYARTMTLHMLVPSKCMMERIEHRILEILDMMIEHGDSENIFSGTLVSKYEPAHDVVMESLMRLHTIYHAQLRK